MISWLTNPPYLLSKANTSSIVEIEDIGDGKRFYRASHTPGKNIAQVSSQMKNQPKTSLMSFH